MATRDCIAALTRAAGRALSDSEVGAIFERIHKAALDLKAGRIKGEDIELGRKLGKAMPWTGTKGDKIIQQAAQLAAEDLKQEAALIERQANLQVLRLSGMTSVYRGIVSGGIKPLEAVELLIHRDYTGRTNIASLEQQVTGYRDYFLSKLQPAWDALGDDFAGFFQDKTKLLDLIRELRGEDTGNALAKKGAAAFHEVAEEARILFNANGGNVHKLDDWGNPQHHSQELVSWAGRDAWLATLTPGERAWAMVKGTPPPAAAARDYWVEYITPLLDRARYVDEFSGPMTDAELRTFLEHAWDNIATDGLASIEPGSTYMGLGKRANRHGAHRQIHFKDAESQIQYWSQFGDRSAVEILYGHISSMARDIAFIEGFGPNPNTTYRTLRDTALQEAAVKDPARTGAYQSQATKLDNLWDYASGKTKPPANIRFAGIADAIAHLNVAGKLGGAAWASFFGDKPMMEAVSNMNDLPMIQRWRNEMALLSPANAQERRLLQREGLMLDSVRSGLNRFYEGLGKASTTGKIANAVMRITGMQAINDIRKGAFGLTLMDAIGTEIKAGKTFGQLADNDVRTLRNYGITEADWKIWQLAELEDMGRGNDSVLTPSAINRVKDSVIEASGLVLAGATAADAKRTAIVKLLGAVNTESEFAIVTPGWNERASFYSGLQRGTFSGEITQAVLQFKAFPWAYLKRGMDAIANMEGTVPKAAMVAYLVVATTTAGAMLYQTRQILAGKDPLKMTDENWMKFWGSAFLYGGALGIYGDFLYSVNETRYGSGPIEALSGPTLGPLLELGIVQPLQEAKKAMEGKETHFWAKTLQDLKGFVPGGNIWYAKAAFDHLIWQQVFEQMSPGYLATIRRKMQRDYNQDWWWEPGTGVPQRLPDLPQAVERR